jgi:ribonuclease HI
MRYVFSDGSSLTPHGIGGAAFTVVEGIVDPFQVRMATKQGEAVTKWYKGYEDTTNNRMEMKAALEGLRWVLRQKSDEETTLVTDSLYVIDGLSKWRRKWEANSFRGTAGPIKNVDVWKDLYEVVDHFTPGISYIHIRGHQGFYWNEVVDKLARAGADSVKEQQTGW